MISKKCLEELADLAITTAQIFMAAPFCDHVVDEDHFWSLFCDEKCVFPGDGPPDFDSCPHIELFACDYTLCWYTADKMEVRRRIRGALKWLLERG